MGEITGNPTAATSGPGRSTTSVELGFHRDLACRGIFTGAKDFEYHYHLEEIEEVGDRGHEAVPTSKGLCIFRPRKFDSEKKDRRPRRRFLLALHKKY